MKNIIKRLELIKSSIDLEDDEVIQLQIEKINLLPIDESVAHILQQLNEHNYLAASKLIEGYIAAQHGLLDLTQKIRNESGGELSVADNDWAERLWAWADENDIGNDQIPRDLNCLKRLTKLRLMGDPFSSKKVANPPQEIGFLTWLTYLELSSYGFSALPKEIGLLTRLTHLDLSFNDLAYLPEDIINLTQLTHLYLCGNDFTEFPLNIAHLPQLTHLYLTSDTKLPNEIEYLSQLTYLFFLSDKMLTVLPSELVQLTKLTCLALDHKTIKDSRNVEILQQLRNQGCEVAVIPGTEIKYY